jgi:glycosyltransferase involved in cell wall biosynthesis
VREPGKLKYQPKTMAICFVLFLLLISTSFYSALNTPSARFLILKRDKVLISPSVAKADFCFLLNECNSAVNAGAEMLHFAVTDGKMAPKLSFGTPILASIRPHLLDTVFDCKLSIVEPERLVKDFAKAGADIISFRKLSCNTVTHRIRIIIMQRSDFASILQRCCSDL